MVTKLRALAVTLVLLAGVPALSHSQGTVPAGATARCRDGTYSFSQSRSGTCSRHGGVAEWISAGTARVPAVRTDTSVRTTQRPPQAASTAPAGATAQCRDGTYSFSQHRSGTCSRHGGVSRWL